MTQIIESAQRWFRENADNASDDSKIHTIPFALLYRKARDVGNDLTIDRNTYANMSVPEKRKVFFGVKNNGLVAPPPQSMIEEEEEDSDSEEEEEDDEEIVSLASALNFMLADQEDNHEMTRFLSILAKEYKDDDFDLVRRVCTTLHKKTSAMKGDQKFGRLTKINLAQYNRWKDTQTTSLMIVGALQLWNILERTGHGAVSRPSSVTGKEYLTYERPDGKIQQYDRFMVHSNYAEDVEASDDEVNAFLAGLRMQQQTVEYRRISVHAYRVAMAFLSTFQVTIVRGKPATCKMIDDKKEKCRLPAHEVATTKALDYILDGFARKKIRGDSFIVAFENIARYADRAEEIRDAAVDELDTFDIDIDKTMRDYVNTFNNLAKQGGAVKGKALQKLFNTKGHAADAVTNLANYRKIRNASPANTYVNHGVGSVRGYNLPEWYDTYQKGCNMVEWAVENGPDIVPETKFSIYGVAYGHMTPIFTALRTSDAPPKNMQFYDKAKAKNSSETFIVGDVFDHSRAETWVFDDTDTHRLPKSVSGDENKFSGDHLKVSLFMETKSPIIVSKVDMMNFRTQDHIMAWHSLGVKHGYSLQIVKFGRLHNSEVYLCAVPGDPVAYDSIRGDIWGISLCMDVSNNIINMWQEAGMRAALREPSFENGADDNRASLGLIWRALVLALPVNWPWFLRVPVEKEFKTCTAIQEEQEISSYILPEAHEYEIDWQPELPFNVVVEGRLKKPKLPTVAYYDGVELDVDTTTILGYGADDELQDLIIKGEIDRVVWDEPFSTWRAVKVSEKRGKDKKVKKKSTIYFDDDEGGVPPPKFEKKGKVDKVKGVKKPDTTVIKVLKDKEKKRATKKE